MEFLIAQNLKYILEVGSILLFVIFILFILRYISQYIIEYKTKNILDKAKKAEPKESTPEVMDNLLEPESIEPEHHDEMTKKLMKVGLKKEQIEKLSHHINKK